MNPIIPFTEADKLDRELQRAYQAYAAAMQAYDNVTEEPEKQAALARLRAVDKQIQDLRDKEQPVGWDGRIA